jgi:hypothetical protein
MWKLIVATLLVLTHAATALPPELMDDDLLDQHNDTNYVLHDVSSSSRAVVVSKCCPVDAVLVETALGVRACQGRNQLSVDEEANAKWSPTFHDLDTEEEVNRPNSYVLDDRYPACDFDGGEVMFPVYHHEHTDDVMLLLTNGSLAHRLVHESGHTSVRVLYPPGKYCVDDMVVVHNSSNAHGHDEEEVEEGKSVVEFAFICVNNKVGIMTLEMTFEFLDFVLSSSPCLRAV